MLVNEFGEIGVDRSLLDAAGVAIEEVAGGCLCCVAAPAFTVGLNRLIRTRRPARILIEPSGLGHPAQVLDTLRSPLYQQVLEVQATLCVMDARHLASPRHRAHPNFVDQVHLADILVANKADCYDDATEQACMRFAAGLQPPKSRLLITTQGRVDASLLQLGAQQRQAAFPEAHAFLVEQAHDMTPAPQGDWVIAGGAGDGYQRLGWFIAADLRFDRQRLLAWLDRLPVERAMGVFHCDDGWWSYNRRSDAAQVESTRPGEASRLQLIDCKALDEAKLDAALRDLVAG